MFEKSTWCVLIAACLVAVPASAQQFSYATDGLDSSLPSGTTTYEVDNSDGWDGVLSIYASDETDVEDDLEAVGCTITAGTPPEIACADVEDLAEVTDYILALQVKISAVEVANSTTVRVTFGDGAEAWASMPPLSSDTAMEIMSESSDPDCTWTCTYGEGIYDSNGNSIPPYITCYTTAGSSCCELNCDPNPDPPEDGASRLGGALQRLGSATFGP